MAGGGGLLSGGCGAVAAGHELTVRAAEQVLRDGGNAYDGVLAALLAACVCEPVLASPGGGGFLLAKPAAAPACVYDFFVHTPISPRPERELEFYPVTVDFGTARQVFHIGRGTVAVPGLVKGIFEIHRQLGSLPLGEVFAPAVALAREGVTVTPYQAYLFGVVRSTYGTPPCLAIFGSQSEAGALKQAGEVLRQPELADVLECLCSEGEGLFYRGEIGARAAADLQAGGHLTRADFERYELHRRAPLALDYRDVRVLANPPPASGGLLTAFALTLNAAMEGPPLQPFGTPAHIARVAHVLQATGKARVAALAEGDADGAALLAPALVARYAREVLGRCEALRGTTHISIADRAGNVAAMTVSNGEGSGYVVPGTGIVMNNMLGEEDLNPQGFHRWPLAHRMTSMMSPTVVLQRNGDFIATGSGGSNRIRTAVFQVLLNLLDFDMSLPEAVQAPRIHVEGDFLSLEGGFDEAVLAPLLAAFPDHQQWDDRNMFFGGAHTVARQGKGLLAAGDPRRGGAAYAG